MGDNDTKRGIGDLRQRPENGPPRADGQGDSHLTPVESEGSEVDSSDLLQTPEDGPPRADGQDDSHLTPVESEGTEADSSDLLQRPENGPPRADSIDDSHLRHIDEPAQVDDSSPSGGGRLDEPPRVDDGLGQRAITDALSRRDAVLQQMGGVVDGARDGGPPSLTMPDGRPAGGHGTGGTSDDADDLAGRFGFGESGRINMTFEAEHARDDWTLESMSLHEGLNQPYCAQLTLVTEQPGAEPARLLGLPARVTLDRFSQMRNLAGIITEVTETHTEGRQLRTSVTLEPAFALLRQRVNTKLFQDWTVPEILGDRLFDTLGEYNRRFENRTERIYYPNEFRTQFDETDLDFCNRLMEEEGIIYWFEQADDEELLVLADHGRDFHPIESQRRGELQFSEFEGNTESHEVVRDFSVQSQLCSTKLATKHFDWTHSRHPITGDSLDNDPHEEDDDEPPRGEHVMPEREVYEHDWEPLNLFDYNENYQRNDLDEQLRFRRDQVAFESRLASGSSTSLAMTAGRYFELTDHPQTELCERYLLLDITHQISAEGCTNVFRCMPMRRMYRPPRVTPKPRVPGIQTAKVVGPPGEEIHTDPHGRVRVQFHWDRDEHPDGDASCWLRVMQPWAGEGWGFVFIPRVGQEVVVTFVNGDPDRPLVTGAVYNDAHITPHELPYNKTRSTIKTQSSPGGQGYNELSFEDEASREQIIIHAQKDFNETVRNMHNTVVGNCQTNTVTVNHTNSVGANHVESVGGNQLLSVNGNRVVAINGNQQVTVSGGESLHRVETKYHLDASEEILETAANSITLKVDSSVITIEPNKITLESGGGAKLVIDENVSLVSSQGSEIAAGQEVTTSSADGSAVGLSNEITLTSSQNAQLKLTADGELVSSAGGFVKVTGPLVKLNC